MAFQPQVNQELSIEQTQYRITEHPAAPGIPYGQEGRQAVVYQLVSDGDHKRALKVFKPRYRVPALVSLADRLSSFAHLPGLAVCQRTVLNARRHDGLLRAYPDLAYAVLMTWIEGPTWMEVLLEKRALNPEQSLHLARGLAELLASMEEQGLAHCDLSGPNVLLPALVRSAASGVRMPGNPGVALVDVEQMYGPSLNRPHLLPGGSPGYAHRTAPDGLWSPEADRFAGAILIAEMLGWHDAQIRGRAWGESFFDPDEIAQDSDRYLALHASLERCWGVNAARLLERAWRSDVLAECPTFGGWLIALPTKAPQLVSASTSGQPRPSTPPDTSTAAAQALIDLGEELARQGNYAAALTAYRQAEQITLASSALRLRIIRRLEELQEQERKERRGRLEPPTPSVREQPAESQPADDLLSARRWRPEIQTPSRNALLGRFILAFAGVGLALAVLVLLFPGLLASVGYNFWLMGGASAFNSLGVGALVLIISLIQVWIFRERVRGQQKFWFILITVLSGAVGGAAGGAMLQSRQIGASEMGLVAGAVTGVLTSLGQMFLIHNEAKWRWLVWNTAGWALALYAGWALSLAIGGWSGTAIGAGLIMIAMGVSLALFLRLSPEFEF